MGLGAQRFRHWLFTSWQARSLLISAIGSVVDVCVLLSVSYWLGTAAWTAAACGVTCGSITNFVLNRRYAFQDSKQPLIPQAIRYGLGMAVLIALHAWVVSLLTVHLEAPLLVAKYSSDVLVLLGGNLLLLRYVVFRPVPASSVVAVSPGQV